jgi:hypothetical protein
MTKAVPLLAPGYLTDLERRYMASPAASTQIASAAAGAHRTAEGMRNK